MSNFNFQDQLDALKYVLENHGLRFVSIEIDGLDENENPKYTFVYAKLGTLNYQYNKMIGEIDELIMGEIKRFQSEPIRN